MPSEASRTETDRLRIRQVGPDDWRLWRGLRLRALQESPDAFGSTYEREVGFGEEDFRRRLGDGSPAVLAFSEDEPVAMGAGFVDLPGWLHVVAMWTTPEWRGHGVGGRILHTLVGWARERNLSVHLDVAAGNAVARGLYERAGFVGTGERRPLREGATHLVERMVLPEASDEERAAGSVSSR